MPNYFADYDTTVHFISQEEFEANHTGMPHGGMVIPLGRNRYFQQACDGIQPDLGKQSGVTSSVLLAYARAVYRMAAEGQTGARTVLDVPLHTCHPSRALK